MSKEPNICINDGCFSERRKRGKKCSACASREWREKNKVRAAYILLKSNAKQRGKEFTISLEYFAKFCKKYNYIHKKGIYAESYTVDRIDDTKGYVEGNLQALTNSDNVIKKMLDRRLAAETGQYKVFQLGKRPQIKKDKDDEVPF